jgi:hypothetical protein
VTARELLLGVWLGMLYESAADPDPIPTLFNEISLTRRLSPRLRPILRASPDSGRGGHERQPRWKAPHGKRSGQVTCFQALRGFPEGDEESRIGFLEELAGALGESVEEGGRGLLGTLRGLVLNRGRAEHRSSRRSADCCSSGLDLFDQPSDKSRVVFGSEMMTPAGQGREEGLLGRGELPWLKEDPARAGRPGPAPRLLRLRPWSLLRVSLLQRSLAVRAAPPGQTPSSADSSGSRQQCAASARVPRPQAQRSR